MDDIIGVVISILSRQFIGVSDRLRKETDSYLVAVGCSYGSNYAEPVSETLTETLKEFLRCAATYRAIKLASKTLSKTMNRVLMPVRAKRVFTRVHCDSLYGVFEITPDDKYNGTARSFSGGQTGFYVNGKLLYTYNITNPAARFRKTARTEYTNLIRSGYRTIKIMEGDLTIIIKLNNVNEISLQLIHYGLRVIESETPYGYQTTIEPVDSLPMYVLKFLHTQSHILNIQKDTKLSTYILEGHLAAEDPESLDIMIEHLTAYGYKYLAQ